MLFTFLESVLQDGEFWVLLEVCTTTRTKTVKRKSSVLRKLRQDVWRDKTFVRSCIVQSWDIDVTERVRTCLSCIYSCFKLGKTVGSNYIRSILQQANPSVQLFYFKNLWDSSKLNRTEAVMHLGKFYTFWNLDLRELYLGSKVGLDPPR